MLSDSDSTVSLWLCSVLVWFVQGGGRLTDIACNQNPCSLFSPWVSSFLSCLSDVQSREDDFYMSSFVLASLSIGKGNEGCVGPKPPCQAFSDSLLTVADS